MLGEKAGACKQVKDEPKHNGISAGDVADKSVTKLMFVFLIPFMLSNGLQSIAATISSILLGRWVGEDALAAVSAVFPVLFFLISFVIGIGSGSTVLIGQAYGAGNQKKLKEVMGTTLTFTFVLGAILAVAGGIFTADALRLIGTPANILASTIVYTRIIFWALPALFLYVVYTTFLRGTGDSKTPSYFLTVSTALNLLLAPLLILGLWGLPRLGINGSAYANVIATLVTFVVFLVYLNKVKHPMRFDRDALHYLKIDWQILKLLIKIGIPSSVQMIMVSLSEVAVISLVNHFGSNSTAAYGAVNQVINYVQMPAVSLGMTVSIFGAQAIGAGRAEQLKDLLRSGLKLNLYIGGVLIILVYLFAHNILSWFLTDPATLKEAYGLVRITLWAYLVLGVDFVVVGIMRSSGTVFWPTVLSILAIWGVEVPTAWYLSGRIGVEGIWIGYPVSFIFGLAVQVIYYRFFWRKKRHTKLIE